MDTGSAVLLGLAGVGAGIVNTAVGSGTLLTFPVLLGIGLPPVQANVTNNIGLVPGSLSGAFGYRRELSGQLGRIKRYLPASLLGGLLGAVLLLVLPAGYFKAIVPALIGISIVLIVAQPRLARRFSNHQDAPQVGHRPMLLWVLVMLAGVYGGYFGAAQGVMLLGILGVLLDSDVQRMNALKNLMAGVVNGTAGVVFILFGDPNWIYVAIIAVGAVLGGQVGAHVGRRLPPRALRSLIVVVGFIALVKLLFFS